MEEILRRFFNKEKEFADFEKMVDKQYEFQIHYYNNYILKFLNSSSELVNTGIGFSNGDDRRYIIELNEFADLFYEKRSPGFIELYGKFVIKRATNRLNIDNAYNSGDKLSFAMSYIYYFNCLINIAIALLRELSNQDLFSYEYKPISDDEMQISKEDNIDINYGLSNEEDDCVINEVSPEQEIDEYLRGEREMDEMSLDAEILFYEMLDED